jgi:hypothetical protein
MQGFERMDRQLTDAGALAGHLVPAGSMFAFLAAHRGEVFPDEDYADLFAPLGFGRPSVPATQMAAVMTLQVLHDYSDRETAEAVRFDVRWKVAIGAALDDKGCDPSTLVYWRNRIAKSARPDRISDAVRKIVEQTGVVKGRRRRAVDSTILDDAVATQDTVTQLVSAIRKVAREVPGAAEQIAAVCSGHDYSRPGKPKVDWDDAAAKEELVSALVNDANALVEVFKDAKLGEKADSALALLALVAGQDVEPAEGSDGRDGRWRIARKVAEDRVISTVDPDARHTRKSPEARRDGYRAHVAADPGTGIITDEKMTRAAGQDNSDPSVAEEFVASEDTAGSHVSGDGPLAWYGDSAYGTGDLRDAIAKAGHQAVIKPKPVKPAVEGGFTPDDFHRRCSHRDRDLPGRCHPPDHRPERRHLRGRLPALPAPQTVHDRQRWPHPAPARTRQPAARRPGRLATATPGLHETPAQRRARRRPGRHLAGAPAQAPLPRSGQEPRLAQTPHRRAEPAHPARPRPGPRGRRLGTGHLTRPRRRPASPGTRPAASYQARPPGQHDRHQHLPCYRRPRETA